MNHTQIKKDTGIDSIFNGYSFEDIEVEKSVEVSNNDNIIELLKEYDAFLKLSVKEKIKHKTDILVSNDGINLFLSVMNTKKTGSNFHTYSSLFLSNLIQNLYDSNENNLILDFSKTPCLSSIFEKLNAKKENPLVIYAKGGLNTFVGGSSENLTLFVDGDVGNCTGHNSRNFNLFVNGNAGDRLGVSAKNMSAYVSGNVSKGIGMCAKNSLFLVDGEVKEPGIKTYPYSFKVIQKNIYEDLFYKDMKRLFEERFK